MNRRWFKVALPAALLCASSLLSAAPSKRAPSTARRLTAPFGLKWGASPELTHTALLRSFRDVGSDNPLPDHLLYERRYEGGVLGLTSDHVAPLFFGARLFGVAASFSPSAGQAASAVWETLVDKLTRDFGEPEFRSKPQPLLSWNAILSVLPPEANRTALLTLYNAAAKDPAGGKYMLADFQVQVGLWIPEASWTFANGAVVKVLMRAGAATPTGFTGLKPTVLYTSYEQLK